MKDKYVRVLVTGAAGFLGRNIVRYLSLSGIDVVSGMRRMGEDCERAVCLDLCDATAIERILTAVRPSLIINCAAYGVDQSKQSYGDAFAVNVKACADLIKAAARLGVSRVIHVGSCSEYAASDEPMSEDAPQRPHNLYALSKAAGTMAVLELGAAIGIDVSVVRPFGMWGPWEPAFRIIPQVIAACQTCVPLALTECDVVRDYSFVGDAARWIGQIALSDDLKPGSILNVGSGRPVVLREFVLTVAEKLRGGELMEFGKRPQRPNEPRTVVPDVSRLKQVLGPLSFTSLDDGLVQMLDVRS